MLRCVDYFAGGGGFSTAAVAMGLDVVAAVNHWPRAVETHAANHPHVMHICQDAALVDPAILPPYDFLLASPACQGHTRARGVDRPKHDADRATAWCVVNAAEITRPRAIIVENVPDFASWALFPSWCDALRRLGYNFTLNILDAADYEVPQNRRRLFVVALRDRAAPQVTPPVRALVDHVPVRRILDFAAGIGRR